MSLSIKRLGPGDEAILEILAREDADFDLDGRGQALEPLKPVMAQRYLSNPAVLHWVALDGEVIAGFLYCLHLPLRSGIGHEVLLYEIGVRRSFRRQGTGRALLTHMENWMQANGASEVWVAADNQVAVDFYRACGFSAQAEQPVYMTREIERVSKKMVSTLLSPM
jgi:ribosomal protein S18 acetylase RimI-like enzyme